MRLKEPAKGYGLRDVFVNLLAVCRQLELLVLGCVCYVRVCVCKSTPWSA